MRIRDMGLALLISSLLWLALAIFTGWGIIQLLAYLSCGIGCVAEFADKAA